jgi:hypothetical protein
MRFFKAWPALPAALAGLLTTFLAVAGVTPVVRGQGEARKVQEGQPAPDVELPATQIGKVLPGKADAGTLHLSDLKGKNVVLYFFPKASTAG